MISTLLISITTCLTMGTGTFIQGRSLEKLNEDSNNLIQASIEYLQPIETEINNLECPENDMRMILFDSAIRSRICSDSITEEMQLYRDTYMTPDVFYTDFSIEELYDKILQSCSKYEEYFEQWTEDLRETDRFVFGEFETADNEQCQKEEITIEGTPHEDELKDYTEHDENPDETDFTLLPIIDGHDDAKAAIKINQNIEDKLFIGFDFEADTCISFYNTVSKFLNNKAMLQGLNRDPLFDTLVGFVSTFEFGKIALAKIASLFQGLWSELNAAFLNLAPYNHLIAALLTFVAVTIFIVLASIYSAGAQCKGYRTGALRHGFLNWEWLNEIY